MVRLLVSVIIVNYRSVDFTRRCIQSIYKSGSDIPVEIIVIDNASFDGCEEMLSQDFPEVRFIQSSQNLGFAGANNVGVDASNGTYILFLNPDTEVQPKAIDKLHAALKQIPDAGMAGAHLLNSDLSIQTSSITAFPSILNQMLGVEFLRKTFPHAKLWGIRPLFDRPHSPVAVDAVSGACMMASRTVVETVQGFTSRYFMYAEDLDLCLKVKKAGWNVYYVPSAVVIHHGGQSSGQRSEDNYADIMMRESNLQFMRMHRGRWYAWLFRAATALMAAFRVLLLILLWPLGKISGRDYSSTPMKKWWQILAWALGFNKWSREERAISKSVVEPAA